MQSNMTFRTKTLSALLCLFLRGEYRLHPTIDFQAKAFRHQYIEVN